ncbi:hypothetical protein A3K73_06035 [Candidatus Pacearchaeota archaeon RBG_13_36_9]|nr:MAG: hypothetical protein A3K73_06035 [Candidatus Pacearchaeota archaeon RBG_13_36_9]
MVVNEITMAIVKNARDGESIRSLARRIGFAYSAVYKWVLELEEYGVVSLIKKGNKNKIKINKNVVYQKFLDLDDVVGVIRNDKVFWGLIKNLKLKVRFVMGSAATIWTQGGFVTGDFYERIYFLEVNKKDVSSLRRVLDENEISYTEREILNKRPLVVIISKKDFKIEKKDGLPVMPLNELVEWCKKLQLENILEHLDLMYGLKLKARHAEVYTNG